MAFGIIDYAVFGATLLISAAIGIYYRFTGGKQGTTQEYLMGNRNQKVIPVAFSLVASFASSISILGNTSEAYLYGTHFFVIVVPYVFSTLVAAIFYLPVFYKNNTVSVYEYLEKRFGRKTRLAASLAFTIEMILYMGIVHYAPALAMEAVTGISQITTILLVGFICILYSTIGGIKAVIITDLFQTILMFAAIYAVIVTSVLEAGSFSEIWHQAEIHGRIQYSKWDLDPTERTTWWTVFFGGFLTHIAIYAVNQAQVQRCLSMKSYKKAAWALIWSCPLLIAFTLSLCAAGLCIFYKYRLCDPLKERRLSTADQLLPLYVMETFDGMPGLTGVFVAGIFSASLSTVSAAVNSLAAVTLEDYVKPIYKYYKLKELKDENCNLSKMLALGYGVVCLIVAIFVRNYGSILQTCFVIFGVVGGPLFALFTLGIACPFVGEVGALIGFFAGAIFSFFIGFGGPKPPPNILPTGTTGCQNFTEIFNNSTEEIVALNSDYMYVFRVSYLYYIVVGFVITMTAGLVFGNFGSRGRDCDPDLFTPLVANYVRRKRRRNQSDEAIRMNEIDFPNRLGNSSQKY